MNTSGKLIAAKTVLNNKSQYINEGDLEMLSKVSTISSIDSLRKQLEESFIESSFILNEHIIKLSEDLDRVIIEYYK